MQKQDLKELIALRQTLTDGYIQVLDGSHISDVALCKQKDVAMVWESAIQKIDEMLEKGGVQFKKD
jgi:hypothetical protein